MPTKKQIQANRLNSRHSTGPRSAEGKAASSQNALKSGIDAQSQIIRGEDPAALTALAAQYLLDHQPQSASERALVDILIDSEWLLRRLRKTESHLWEYHLADLDKCSKDRILGIAFIRAEQTFARLERRRESLQRAYHRTLQDLRQVQDSRRATPSAQPDIPAAAPPEAPQPSPPLTPPPTPLLTPSSQTSNPKIGFVPENPQIRPAPPSPTLGPATPLAPPMPHLPTPQPPSPDRQPRQDAA
jgi:hypothetical protein